MEQQDPLSSEEVLKVSQRIDHSVHGISLLLTPHSKLHKFLVINRVLYYLLKTTSLPASPLGMLQEAITLTTPPNDLVDTEKTEMIMHNFSLENERSTEELITNVLSGLSFDELMSEITRLLVSLFTCVNGANLTTFNAYVDVLRTIVKNKLSSKADEKALDSTKNQDAPAFVEKSIKIDEADIEHNSCIVSPNSDGSFSSVDLDELEEEDLCGIVNSLCNTLYSVLMRQDVTLRKQVLNQLNLRLSITHVDNPSSAIN